MQGMLFFFLFVCTQRQQDSQTMREHPPTRVSSVLNSQKILHRFTNPCCILGTCCQVPCIYVRRDCAQTFFLIDKVIQFYFFSYSISCLSHQRDLFTQGQRLMGASYNITNFNKVSRFIRMRKDILDIYFYIIKIYHI